MLHMVPSGSQFTCSSGFVSSWELKGMTIEDQLWTAEKQWKAMTLWRNYFGVHPVFPQTRPAGIIFLLGVQLRVLLERGYYSRASINFSMCKFEKIKPANIVEILHKFPRF